MTVRRRVVVRGRVQGVFFRDSCLDVAERMGVSGWVRNRGDGRSVEAVFEGGESAVAAMVEWCRRGPQRARVDGVDVFDEAPEGLGGFRVTW